MRAPSKSWRSLIFAGGILLVTPVLYVLSAPPVCYGTLRLEKRITGKAIWPRWLVSYMVPYRWLAAEAPLSRPCRRYDCWWYGMMSDR